MMHINQNNPIELRNAGYTALNDALGPVGTIRFLQQFNTGVGDYTKEKYTHDDIIPEDAESLMESFTQK
ncbi:MAG: hypothetical protein LUG52_09310 [Clostridia bacterium]|nr:hypothetical protein [Clostridia bacterium]